MNRLNQLTKIIDTIELGANNIFAYEETLDTSSPLAISLIEDEAETTICAIRDILESN